MSSKETREGVTYKSGVGLDEGLLDVDEIPPPRYPPTCTEGTVEDIMATEIYFDLETTGLGKNLINYKCRG